jgi:hypothetical protein
MDTYWKQKAQMVEAVETARTTTRRAIPRLKPGVNGTNLNPVSKTESKIMPSAEAGGVISSSIALPKQSLGTRASKSAGDPFGPFGKPFDTLTVCSGLPASSGEARMLQQRVRQARGVLCDFV